MKKNASFVLVCCLIATGFAKPPVYLGYQDSLGQYSFGYSAPGSARSEVRTSNGATRGTYSYVDKAGVIQIAHYVADGENGFRVVATNLPQAPLPVQDTPEVMAARTEHLQALEMATKRGEAQSQEENLENARRTEGKLADANPDETREQPSPDAKSAGGTVKEEERKQASDGAEKESDESLRAVASRNDVDRKSEKNQGQESNRRMTQEIIGGANIPAIPLISSHVLLPQAADERAVPVFRITHGSHEIEPSAIPESSIAQGHRDYASGTPAGTALKSATVSTKKAAMPKEQISSQGSNDQAEPVNTLIAPLNVIPLSSSYSSFIRYISPTSLHYVTYNVL
ncbi:PREDICTED: uncharacterized protein LOC106746651 [Dinoponera quadriceps]|uniref:Uncharacterized protein LOC106746651 n=1 Tax=Dinoponera quadriceps TaxID=609295 RepID=A0A6P3XKY9_DINQU|nr:PREDICTED: uncharacterized protein LOC106746651 [Dinoponera quadriceps]